MPMREGGLEGAPNTLGPKVSEALMLKPVERQDVSERIRFFASQTALMRAAHA